VQEHREPTGALLDPGLIALVMMLRFQGLGVDPEQIRHQFGGAPIGLPRCCVVPRLCLKARVATTNWARLPSTPMPALAALRDGGFLLLARPAKERSSSWSPVDRDDRHDASRTGTGMGRPPPADDEAGCPERPVASIRHHLVSRRSPQVSTAFGRGPRCFAFPSAVRAGVAVIFSSRHRQGAGTPQHEHAGRARDRSRRYRNFETVLGVLRTYLFSHTTNRIDVELGARLFRHLLALPISYFQARRVGDSVARVRELENIRNFLTSSGLTLVIDLFFTFIFIAVLFFYSPLLTWIVLSSFPFYVGISAVATPLFQQRLDEKFRRGAEISPSSSRA